MARSVVLNQTVRCEGCLHPPRWCICASLQPVTCPFAIDVLMHHRESLRPTSTGQLITRLVPSALSHLHVPGRPVERGQVLRAGMVSWLLHPQGEPMPPAPLPANLQVILLDGSWRQAGGMARELSGWGRKIALPMIGESRYWLRAQQEGGRFSTMEALLFLLQSAGLREQHEQLRLQLELHVYAGLCVRGNKALAARFLSTSPLLEAMPDQVRALSGGDPDEEPAQAI